MAAFTENPIGWGAIQTGTPATGLHTFWGDAVNAPDGVVWQHPNQLINTVTAQCSAGRGAPQYRVTRLFGWFDLTAYTPNITSIEFEFDGLAVYNGPQLALICKSFAYLNATTNTLSPGDFQIGLSWDPGVQYSVASPLGSSTFIINGNSTCVNEANANGYINIALIQYDNDYLVVSPGTTSVVNGGQIDLDPFNNFSNGIYSTGYVNTVNGVPGGDISNVINMGSADISVIIGV